LSGTFHGTDRNKGFSLGELVVVLGILAILLTIGLMYISRAKANRELDGAATEMLNALKYARAMAISASGTTITFTNGNKTYTIQNGAGQTLKQFTVPASVNVNVPSELSPLTFAANGSVAGGGSIGVVSASTGRTATITVQAMTGTASMTVQ
jgi:prepilin-type N-terminal cleavage/methylation domain-containing protein